MNQGLKAFISDTTNIVDRIESSLTHSIDVSVHA